MEHVQRLLGSLAFPQLCLDAMVQPSPPRPALLPNPAEGAVMLLRAEPPLLRTERQLAPRRDFEVLHAAHSDWVTRLQHIPGARLRSCWLAPNG